MVKCPQPLPDLLGGVPKLLIPDNLRSAVKKADRYEPVINDSYQALAEHYGTVIIPARPRKPKDKPKAENGVLIVERWLLARIRNETFHTLRALNARLRELLTDMNNRPMKGVRQSNPCRTLPHTGCASTLSAASGTL